jgi:hypothetical protein
MRGHSEYRQKISALLPLREIYQNDTTFRQLHLSGQSLQTTQYNKADLQLNSFVVLRSFFRFSSIKCLPAISLILSSNPI